MKAAKGEWEFCVEVERGGSKATEGNGELCIEGELEAKLGFSGATFCYNFGYGIAGDASAA